MHKPMSQGPHVQQRRFQHWVKLVDPRLSPLCRLSLKIEPATSTPRAHISKEDLVGKTQIWNERMLLYFFLWRIFGRLRWNETLKVNSQGVCLSSVSSTPGQELSASPLCGRKGTIAPEGTKVSATPPSPRNLLPYSHRKSHSLGYKSVPVQVTSRDHQLLGS